MRRKFAHLHGVADQLINAYDDATTLPSIAARLPDFDVSAAYDVLLEIERRRLAQGWRSVGRKIGFTNRTIWKRYGVYQPMWASVWAHTVHHAVDGRARLALDRLVQPRIEPEVVFKLRAPIAAGADARTVLEASEWIAAGFEIVQSHYPDWKFTAADYTAAFGLHGALVVGTPLQLKDVRRDSIEAILPNFRLTLRKGEAVIDRGEGANVLDSPALAITYLADVLATQPDSPPLAAGELVTTGTLTDAWPVAPSQTWFSDYGELPLSGLALTLL